MDALIGLGFAVWVFALVLVGFCLFISPLMIWKHAKDASRKLDKVISLLEEDRTRR